MNVVAFTLVPRVAPLFVEVCSCADCTAPCKGCGGMMRECGGCNGRRVLPLTTTALARAMSFPVPR